MNILEASALFSTVLPNVWLKAFKEGMKCVIELLNARMPKRGLHNKSKLRFVSFF